MKGFFSPSQIAAMTCAIVVIVSVLWFRSNSEPESYEKIDFARIPTVEYCDLKNNPQRYDGKIIRIKAKLLWNDHGYYFAGEKCLAEGDKSITAVSIYSANSGSIYLKLNKTREPNKPLEPINLVAVGRFTYKTQLGMSDSNQDRTHLQFEIYEVEYIDR